MLPNYTSVFKKAANINKKLQIHFCQCFRSSEWIAKKSFYFHALSWLLPAIQTVLAYLFGAIDGDPVTGVCYVGNTNSNNLLFFVIGNLILQKRTPITLDSSTDYALLSDWPTILVYWLTKLVGHSIQSQKIAPKS